MVQVLQCRGSQRTCDHPPSPLSKAHQVSLRASAGKPETLQVMCNRDFDMCQVKMTSGKLERVDMVCFHPLFSIDKEDNLSLERTCRLDEKAPYQMLGIQACSRLVGTLKCEAPLRNVHVGVDRFLEKMRQGNRAAGCR